MNRFRHIAKVIVSVFLAGVCSQLGCQPQQPLFLTEKGHYQNHYINKATRIEYPDVDVSSLPEVCRSIDPLTLTNPDPTSMWDLTLEEAIQIALKNSKVIRTLNGVGFSKAGVSGVPGTLLQSPNGVGTVYDPALVESDPRYGIEAALSAFDGQLQLGANWTKSDTPYWDRDRVSGTQSDSGVFNTRIQKYAATGGQFYVDHVNSYSVGGATGSTPSQWGSYLEGGFTQPLLRGNGIQFNRIAGPNSVPGMYSGVAIARISTDTSLNDFEMATRNLVADVEKAYLNLYYAFHRLESVRSGRDSAYQTWAQTKAKKDAGGKGGSAQYLAQAEHNYFTFRQQTEVAQSNLFTAENALRYIMGLTATDGRLIRPIDYPVIAPIKLEWQSILCEALLRSPELRKQKWDVKRRELELIAAKNFLLPRLDFNANYRFSGAGKDLIDSDNRPGNAYSSLTGGDYAGWMMGLSASMPFGWRQELAGVRNAQLQLARSRAILNEQELELSHQLTDSVRQIALAYQLTQTTLAGRRSASDEVNAVGAAFAAGTITLDQLLDAQRRQAEAETDYYSAVVDYNLAIMTLHYRKGSLLEYNNVCLTEGQWPAKAYFDAKRRARERDAGTYLNYGFTRPKVVSKGSYQQFQNNSGSVIFDGPVVPQSDPSAIPSAPTLPGASPKVIETEPSASIPVPVLPQLTNSPSSPAVSAASENTPVSFTKPNTATPAPTRSNRYVQNNILPAL